MKGTTCPLCQGRAVVNTDHPILKNTVANLQAISLLAATVSLAKCGIECEILTDAPDGNNPTDLVLTWDREAYDGMGYHVGTEVYTAIAHIIDVDALGGGMRIPHGFDHYVIFFDSFDPKLVSAPDPEDDEDMDGNMDAYCQPDDEFICQEFQALMRDFWKNLPVAVFDKETRVWHIGEYEWHVNAADFEYF